MKRKTKGRRATGPGALSLVLWFALGMEPAAADLLVFRGATVHTAAGALIEDAVLVIEGSRIVSVGPRGSVAIPRGSEIVELPGRVIVPGLVDTHSHIGLYPRPLVSGNRDGNEGSKPVTPEIRALDAIWPGDPAIAMALAGGVTTVNVMPGSGNVVGGQTAYLKLRGRTVDEMLLRDSDGTPVLGGMKMANGENPKRSSPKKAPMTRMAVAFLERKLFLEAQAYRDEWEKSEKRAGEAPPARDLRLEPMVEVLEGRRIVHHHTHRADDIVTVLRIAEEFGHRVVLQHATEAPLVAEQIVAAGVPVSTLILDSPGGKHEALGLHYTSPGRLEAAGVKVALHSDDLIISSRFLLRTAALAVRGGMTEAGALRAVTRHAAEMLDLGDRLGSLQTGRDADFVILSGPPFSVHTQVLETWIDGKKRWDRSNPRDRLYQTGGFQVPDRYPTLDGPQGVAP